MTVSFVLNNTPGQVSEETRERVLRVVREMGYRPRLSAASSAEAAVRTVGIAVGRRDNDLLRPGYFSFIFNGIVEAADRRNLSTLMFHASLFREDPHKSIRTYFDGRCDGLLLIAPIMGMPLVTALKERGVPFVLIGDQGDVDGIASVDLDNRYEARQVTQYLIDRGHRRIAFVGGPDFVRSACQRREGYRAALEANGIDYDPILDLAPLHGEHQVYETVHALARRKDIKLPTALIGWNDTTALRSLSALEDAHLRIPDQVSVIGFDDSPSALTAIPSLSSVRQPYREIGAKAVEVLLERINGDEACARPHFLPGRLIERDSVRNLTTGLLGHSK